MAIVPFTLGQLEQALRDVAAENPDYVYVYPGWREGERAACFYEHDGESGCIFGHAVARLGCNVEQVFPGNSGGIRNHLILWYGDRPGRYGRFAQVQLLQDMGKPWGIAIQALDDEALNGAD